MLPVVPRVRPPLDPEFVPAVLWNRAYEALVARDRGARAVSLVLVRPDGLGTVHRTRLLSADHPQAALTLRYAERLVKSLLWQRGGSTVRVVGAPEVAEALAEEYSPSGPRAFDFEFMGERVYGARFAVEAARDESGVRQSDGLAVGRHLEGCRVGFDIGGSDRKAAAVINGKVVYSEEIPWNPYFEKDPAYHIAGIHDSIARAASKLPRLDAIGGSAAGVYVNNEVRVASLFRGVPPDAFQKHIRRMFFTLRERWGGVPFEVANDGEVTALAGSMSLRANSVLGISMGTSMAGGYVTPTGSITNWLNELAFSPVDYRADAPRDEWSGDAGCGVQYFSQQAVSRLSERAGFRFHEALTPPERLLRVQESMQEGDPRARAIYETVGAYFGYAIAHYADFYEIDHVLVLGRVTSGSGGGVILDRARAVLREEFPALAERIRLGMPDETDKRHGQAIAAASLPALAGHP
ncbi:hypothetical protein GALL_104340 [mine drainage metagenome]|uniref:Transcriptional regulator n=1 Tax=mine drainage metagenome TaxID=410659 RepID=A0A1J5SHT2_9ZZZZ